MKFHRYTVLTLLVMALATSCSEDDTPVLTGGEPEVYAGITRTDESGTILENDPDDWRTSSFIRGATAYPNPVFGPTCAIKFAIEGDAHVKVIVRTPEAVIRTLVDGTLTADVHTIAWDRKDENKDDAPNDIYRVVIICSPTDGGSYRTYGDVQLIDETQ
jgi:hypothetical protein